MNREILYCPNCCTELKKEVYLRVIPTRKLTCEKCKKVFSHKYNSKGKLELWEIEEDSK